MKTSMGLLVEESQRREGERGTIENLSALSAGTYTTSPPVAVSKHACRHENKIYLFLFMIHIYSAI
jgi:hypothetical protein